MTPKQRATGAPAWLLLVVSSDAQTETLADYRKMADADARAQGWTIARTFEGVSSGKAGPRRLLLEMIGELAATPASSRPAWVWMRRVDRVGRGRIAESTLAMHTIADMGVRIWDHDAGEVKLETAADQIVASVRSGLAAMENEVRRGKATAVYAKRRDAGVVIGNKVPYGIALGPGRTYVAQEPQAEAVRVAFRMAAEGAGCLRIAKRLDEIAPPHRYRNGKEHVVRWVDSRVSRLLRTRAYVGPVIDEVTFLRAERTRLQLGRTSSGRRFSWPLSSALRCYCGRSMNGMPGGHDHLRIRYYLCRARWNHDGRLRMVRADKLEAQFVAMLRRFAEKPELIAVARRAAAPASPALIDRTLKSARARVAEVERKRAAVWDLHLAGKVRADDVQERLDHYAAERAELVERIAHLEAQRTLAADAAGRTSDVAALLREAVEVFERAPEAQQRGIARAFALAVGGLCADVDGELTTRRAEDVAPQRRRRSGEI